MSDTLPRKHGRNDAGRERMHEFDQKRRLLLSGLAVASIGVALPENIFAEQMNAPHGYVLDAAAGEHLIHFRDHGNIFIKAGAATGSDRLALGTQQVTRGAGIPVHRHLEMDEAFYILGGSGTVLLNDTPHACETGGTIFIPRLTWHGFQNPDHELTLLWITSPTGLDGFFRETCSAPGEPPKHFTHEQINQIALKYKTEFR
jgi:quercetin dioxygenase-like cupin family protein